MSLIRVSLAALALVCLSSPAAAQTACPLPASTIAAGNAAALALFKQRVLIPSEVGTAPRTRSQGMSTAESFGAKGDGIADDTKALQTGLNKGGVWLQSGRVYRISRRLELGSGSGLASDGSATVLMSSGPGAFDNAVPRRNESGMYSERGTGMRVKGDNVTISDVFIVKEYADNHYVIGIDIVSSSNVQIRRVRLRGFALAPGIIRIRSSDAVDITGSLIHGSCTQTTIVPDDLPIFQITGIDVDDDRIGGRPSKSLRMHNNVIADLRMVRRTPRGDQTDGIHFGGAGTGVGSVISSNNIQGVDEGIDVVGKGIEIRGNRIGASMPLKFVHGARDIVVTGNELFPGTDQGWAIGLFKARPAEESRQVRNILIERNQIHLPVSIRPGVIVDADGEFPPTAITLRENRFIMARCGQEAVRCSDRQCKQENNEKVDASGTGACRQ